MHHVDHSCPFYFTLGSLHVHVELNGTVITSHDVVIDQGVSHPLVSLLIDHKVIQSPADVLGPSSTPDAPPRILDLFRVFFPESINPTLLQKLGEALSFLNGEPCCALVVLGSGDIDFLVADVQVSTENDCLLFSQALQKFLESSVPFFDSVAQTIKLLT